MLARLVWDGIFGMRGHVQAMGGECSGLEGPRGVARSLVYEAGYQVPGERGGRGSVGGPRWAGSTAGSWGHMR